MRLMPLLALLACNSTTVEAVDVDTDNPTDTDVDTDPIVVENCDDTAEENDTSATAVPIATAVPLLVSDDDPDFYTVEIGGLTEFSLEVLFAHADGDIQVRFAAEGTVQVSESSTDDEQVFWENTSVESVTATVHVYTSSASCVDYTLQTSFVTGGA